MVMPIVDGVDVQTLLQRDGPMSPRRAVQVIEQLAAALNAAHRHGLVHRDIKPSNALVTGDDFVYLIDFGLAHDGAATRLTSTGMMVGTLAYMAPERFTAGIADARADVYALACVLYECLTGVHPYPGESLEQQIAGHLTLDPPKPSERRPDVAAGLDEVIATGMAKKPEQRYQSARELAIAAREALTGVPTPARAARTAPAAAEAAVLPPPPPPLDDAVLPLPPPPEPESAQTTVRLQQSGQGRPGLIAAIVVLGVILVAAGIIGYLLSRSPASQTPTAQPASSSEPTAQPAPSSEPTAQPAPLPAQAASTPYVQLPGIAGCEVAADNVVCEGT
ncbi:MAG: protein kinase domain-containing protein, partial [Mycobacterium sp.]